MLRPVKDNVLAAGEAAELHLGEEDGPDVPDLPAALVLGGRHGRLHPQLPATKASAMLQYLNSLPMKTSYIRCVWRPPAAQVCWVTLAPTGSSSSTSPGTGPGLPPEILDLPPF